MSRFEKHPYFELWLHSTEALEQALGEAITRRETIHDWPLSTVQLVGYGAGQKTIYKCQRGATVEPEFYAQARSPLLPAVRGLDAAHGCAVMLIDFIEGRRVKDLALDEPALLALGRRLADELAGIEGEPPVYTDIGDEARWLGFVEETLGQYQALIDRGVWAEADTGLLPALRRWAGSAAVRRAIVEQAGLTHGDPNGGNLFLVGDELKVIDWQRPRRAPRGTDLACLLQSSGLDPYRHVATEVVQVFEFLLLNWMVVCKTTWFPEGDGYERCARDFAASLLSHGA